MLKNNINTIGYGGYVDSKIRSPVSLHLPYEPLTISSKFFFVHLRSQYSGDSEDKKSLREERNWLDGWEWDRESDRASHLLFLSLPASNCITRFLPTSAKYVFVFYCWFSTEKYNKMKSLIYHLKSIFSILRFTRWVQLLFVLCKFGFQNIV